MSCNCLSGCLSGVGILALVCFGWKLWTLLNQLFRPALDLKKLGQWSVVTGVTSGIGKALAYELAKRGQNVVIIGRDSGKLNTVAAEIREKYPKATIEPLKLDLSHLTTEDKNNYRKCIENKEIGVLINNAGLAYPFVQYFHEVNEDYLEEMIEVNNKAPTWLVRATLPQFLKRKKKEQ